MHALLLAALLAAAPDTITLSPGTQKVVSAPGLTRVAVGDDGVADVSPTGRGELLIVGKKRGRTSLTLWTKAGVRTRTVVVDDGKADELETTLREVVGPGLTVHKLSDRTVIDGTVDSMQELKRLRALVGGDPDVVLLVQLNPRLLPVIAETITGEFKKAGLKQARAVVWGSKIVLEGSVADTQELHRALLIAEAYAEPLSSLSGSR
jgi:pilus assembly protein CpaC